MRHSLLASLLLLAAACAADSSPTTDNADRGPIGKADTVGSCAASGCEGQASGGNCFCDSDCTLFGDCCADQLLVCEPKQVADLKALPAAELDELFKRASTPEVAKLAGELKGTSLAAALVPVPPQLQNLINLIANSTWLGKTFMPTGETTGKGFNRVKIGSELQVAFFNAKIGPGRDGQTSLHLDYGVEQNLVLLRALQDELRQVGPTSYLGKAFLQTPVAQPALFFFAVDAPAAP